MDHYEKVENLIRTKRLDSAIDFCEQELKKLPNSSFHKVIGKTMLDQTEELNLFIDQNFSDPKKISKTCAFYSELNGFSINWDKWFLNILAYDNKGNFYDDESEWLFEEFWGSNNPEYFIITGWGELQAAFQDYHSNEKYNIEEMQITAELTEFLIVLRLQQLFKYVITSARESGIIWSKVPWGVTAHDYHLILEI